MTTPASNIRAATALAVAIVAVATVFPAASAQAADAEVQIDQFTFAPQRLTVKAGTTVTWTNDDDINHTVTSDDGATFDSGAFGHGLTFSFTAGQPGTYTYKCSIHPFMKGTIVVK